MFRSILPIILIPAAWTLTFATIIYPGLDSYWIEHMHYAITGFLLIFIGTSWHDMSSGVLQIWRRIMTIGLVATIVGALSFTADFYPHVLASISLFYWLTAPGIASYFTSKEINDYKKAYRFAGYLGISAVLLYLQGYIISSEIFKASAIFIALTSQTYTIIVAAKLNDIF